MPRRAGCWLLADSVYGVHAVMAAAQCAGLGYVLGVTGQFACGWDSAQATLARVPAAAWQRLSAGAGAKGERWFEWAVVHEWPIAEGAGWTRRVVARRRLTEPRDVHYFVVRSPEGIPLAALARLAGRRWAIEAGFRTAKQKAGLADYEVRTGCAWHRHVSFALAAAAALVLAAVAAAEKTRGRPRRGRAPRRRCPHGADRAPGARTRSTVGAVDRGVVSMARPPPAIRGRLPPEEAY